MSLEKVILIGNGGHAKVIEDIIKANKNLKIYAQLDDKYSDCFVEKDIIKAPIKYIDKLITNENDVSVIIAIGTNEIREKIVAMLELDKEKYLTIVHPSAIISPRASIGNGTVIMPNTVINADSVVGDHVIINSGSIVEHDCKIHNYTHISPGAILTGGVTVKEGSHIGAGSSIIPMKTIGEWSTVGAGSVVINNVDDNCTVVGVPARKI